MCNYEIKSNFLDIFIISFFLLFFNHLILRYNIFSKLTLVSLFRFLDIILAFWENNLSEETEVTRISRYFRVIKNNTGYYFYKTSTNQGDGSKENKYIGINHLD
jgi:hypothetical protein